MLIWKIGNYADCTEAKKRPGQWAKWIYRFLVIELLIFAKIISLN
jgi:hypothetical protein